MTEHTKLSKFRLAIEGRSIYCPECDHLVNGVVVKRITNRNLCDLGSTVVTLSESIVDVADVSHVGENGVVFDCYLTAEQTTELKKAWH